jgi:two-component system OmpR family response regulator
MKILVVEDNRKLASFLQRALTEEGYIVDLVEDGAVARSQIATIAYDLVILDWMLPGVDGLSVCRAARAAGSAVPILMLTARAEVGERIAGLDAGAEPVLVAGPLRVDRSSQSATLDGRKLELTPRELALLTYLVSHAGKPVARTELLAKVWDTAFDPGSNVVEVHVKNLRGKLGAQAEALETVRGVGYRWRTDA